MHSKHTKNLQGCCHSVTVKKQGIGLSDIKSSITHGLNPFQFHRRSNFDSVSTSYSSVFFIRWVLRNISLCLHIERLKFFQTLITDCQTLNRFMRLYDMHQLRSVSYLNVFFYNSQLDTNFDTSYLMKICKFICYF